MSRPFIEFVHPDDVERTAAEARGSARSTTSWSAFENRFRTRTGDWRWLRWNARTDGETWFAVAFDVTERKQAEDELRAAIEQERLLAYSQPIIDQRSGTVVQEELLVRLRTNGDGSTDRVLTAGRVPPRGRAQRPDPQHRPMDDDARRSSSPRTGATSRSTSPARTIADAG